MNLEFIPVITEEDYRRYCSFRDRHLPQKSIDPLELIQHDQGNPPGRPFVRLMVLDEAMHIVGVTMATRQDWVSQPDSYFIVSTVPTEGSETVFPRVADRMVDWCSGQGAKRIQWWARGDQPEQLNLLFARGFVESQRNPESRLLLADLDDSKADEWAASLLAKGVRIWDLSEFSKEFPDTFMEALYDAELEVLRDVPAPDPLEQVEFSEFTHMVNTFKPHWDTYLLAASGDRVLGMSQANLAHGNSSVASTGLTGVRREARRMGIARTLKTLKLSRLRERGVQEIWTDNEENNPMYQLNVQLGFRPVYENVVAVWDASLNSDC